MATAICYEQDGTESGKVDLPAGLFDCKVNEHAVHDAVVAYLANQRQGDASTKERGDVRGGGRKPFRQKGTGRARSGTIRAPQNRGGGVVFGPHPRSYRKKMTKKTKRLALKSALSSRASDGGVVVIKSLSFDQPKTKEFEQLLRSIDAYHAKVLVVLDGPDQAAIKSARNITGVRLTLASMVTTYDVMWADRILITSKAVEKMAEVFAS